MDLPIYKLPYGKRAFRQYLHFLLRFEAKGTILIKILFVFTERGTGNHPFVNPKILK